ncbi:MAG TPA: hypothetical protein VM055_00875 [Novosphingobium sp.]|nr:hypothetical protein [Novosphingobium sp.]
MSKPSPAVPAAAPLARLIARPVRDPNAANDDDSDGDGDALLRAALRLFAEHGLGAARHAQARAEAAFFAGEREGYRWWLAVTRTLDRKLALELSGRFELAADAPGFLPAG